ncbi:MAG: hypothetical protein IPL61_21635 [Myxococcales bacterium]|nr:hypothetical protein [Myxococcales bacterium]
MPISDAERRGLWPQDGARLLLDRVAAEPTRATYAAWVLTATAEHAYQAELDDTGAVALTAVAAATDAAAEDDLRMLARLTARAAAKRAADGLPPWPPRVLRWRGAGRGG